MTRVSLLLGILLAPACCQLPPSIEARSGQPKFVKLRPLERKELDRIQAKAGGALAVGAHRPVDSRSLSKGKWTQLSGGASIWRLGIESPGAAGLRVRFTGFAVGGGKVWVHAPASGGKLEVAGPYTGRGPNNDGDFWSDVVFSPRVLIEYQPAGASRKLSFRIPAVSHLAER